MVRKNIVILRSGKHYEAWGSLKEACEYHPEFSYHYLKRQEYPFDYKGYHFERVPFRSCNR